MNINKTNDSDDDNTNVPKFCQHIGIVLTSVKHMNHVCVRGETERICRAHISQILCVALCFFFCSPPENKPQYTIHLCTAELLSATAHTFSQRNKNIKLSSLYTFHTLYLRFPQPIRNITAKYLCENKSLQFTKYICNEI